MLHLLCSSLRMLSLKVDIAASLPVFSEWELSTSTEFVDDAAKCRESSKADHHNNTIHCKVSSSQMQSYCPVEDKLYVNEDDALFAVFDGHGGDTCSKYISERVPQQLLCAMKNKRPRCDTEIISTLKTTYMRADDQFLNDHKYVVKTSASGSCGVTVLVRNDTLYICNLGDSRVLLGSKQHNWSYELLTNDHNTKNAIERELVKQRTSDPMPIRGHAVNKVPGDRVGGVLMLTRAFGDGVFKRREMSLYPFIHHLPYITNEPEVTVRKLSSTDQYAIISSDGLYEYLTVDDVASFVEKQLETTDGTKIGNSLIEYQFEKIGTLIGKTIDEVKAIPSRKTFLDDVTIIVILFSHPSSSCFYPSPSLPIIGAAAK